MKFKYTMAVLATTLSLLMMGPLYATSPQKSTIILINGDDALAPLVCAGDLTCELRNADVGFIYRHGSDAVTVFVANDIETVCEVGKAVGKDLTVLLLNDSHTCL